MIIAKKSKAVVLIGEGGTEMLALRMVDTPDPADDEVLVRVGAAGLNGPDILQRKGLYAPSPQNERRPGLEVSGVVAAIGAGVSNWWVGDRVVALTNGAGYAEYVNVPAGQVLPMPSNWSFAQAATLPETFFTLQQTLVARAGIEPGMSVLVHGASGGLGGTAIQFARLFGASVIASVSSPEKAKYAIDLGATHLVAYQKEDFVERTLEVTGGRGADRIIDIVGGDNLWRNIKAAAPGATILQLAFLAGSRSEINLVPVLMKSLTIIGSVLGPCNSEQKSAIAQGLKSDIWPALEDGRIRPQRVRTYALDQVADAHTAMEADDHFGKIVLLTDFGRSTK